MSVAIVRFALDPVRRPTRRRGEREIYNESPPTLRWGDIDEVRLKGFDEVRQAFAQAAGRPLVLLDVLPAGHRRCGSVRERDHPLRSAAMTDESNLHALIARVALQERAALRELYDATAGRLLAVVRRLTGDEAAAEDVVQDTFVTVWTRASQFPALRSSPMAWLTTLARHRAIDLMRRRRSETSLTWHDDDGQERQHDIADASGSPLDQLLERQAEGRLAGCLNQLEDDRRGVVLMAYAEGLTHEQLARRLGRPLGTVKTWIRRSLLQLRECLGEPA